MKTRSGMPKRKKILMVLTHDRLDCLKLCLERYARAGSFGAFDRTVLLFNGVTARHRRTAETFMRRQAGVEWDAIEGDGSRPGGIFHVQNECVHRYPGAVYMKTDDDVFVPRGWAERMTETYDAFADRKDLALITPLIPNNAFGLHRLLNVFYPEKLPEFGKRFGAPPSEEAKGTTWHSPYIAEWATRLFLDVDAANEEQRRRVVAFATTGTTCNGWAERFRRTTNRGGASGSRRTARRAYWTRSCWCCTTRFSCNRTGWTGQHCWRTFGGQTCRERSRYGLG